MDCVQYPPLPTPPSALRFPFPFFLEAAGCFSPLPLEAEAEDEEDAPAWCGRGCCVRGTIGVSHAKEELL